MKKRLMRTLAAMCLASVMLAGTAIPASASEPDYSAEIAAMDEWLDGLTLTPGSGAAAPSNPPDDTAPPKMLTADELQALTDTMLELVNEQREQAGVTPLTRDSLLDEAAMIRAAEIHVVDFAGGTPHTRPDGTSYRDLLDELGAEGSRCGENITRSKTGPQAAIASWMDSEGHRKNILRDNYSTIGIGVHQREDGKLDWIQIFMLK